MIGLARILPVLSVFAGGLSPLMAQVPLLNLDFNQASIPGYQSPSLPDAAYQGDFAIEAASTGIGDFGGTGHLVVPQFKTAVGPFSVEAGFRLRDYGIDATASAFILNATEGGQGFSLRVGGGTTYPIRSGTSFPHPSIWAHSLESTDANRANASACVASFSTLGPNGYVLEGYTRTCLQLDEWVHLVATWDGSAIRLYVNGEEQTDSDRLSVLGTYPVAPVQIPVYVGVQDASGDRHFNGQMDFVRVLEGALKGEEILNRYKATGRTEDGAYDCQGAVSTRPIVMQGSCDLTYSKLSLAANDSMEIQYSMNRDFGILLDKYRVPVKYFRYQDHTTKVPEVNQRLYWRARIIRAPIVVPPEAPPVVTVPPEVPPVVTVPPEVPPVVTVPPEVPPVVTVPPENPPVVTVPPDAPPVVTVPPENPPIVTVPVESIPKVTVPEDTVPKIPTRIFARTVAWSGSGALWVPYVAGAEIPGLYRLDGMRIPAVATRKGVAWELRPRSSEAGLVLIRHTRTGKAKDAKGD